MEEYKVLNNNIEPDVNGIIEQKDSETRLKQNQFREDSGCGAIFFKNLKSQYILANNKTLEIFGLSSEQLIGKDDHQIFSNKKEAEGNIKDDQFIFENARAKEVTKYMKGADGRKHWFHIIKIPLFDDKGNVIGLVGIIRDITVRKKTELEHVKIVEAERKRAEELKRAYRELQKSKDELVHSEKLAYTGRIAASIAHEIRNPLTNVSMSVQRFKNVIKSDDPSLFRRNSLRGQLSNGLEIIERNMERINYLITELLNCARPPRLDIRPHNFSKILKNILDASKAKIKAQKIKVIKNATFKATKIMVDKEQIERALLNIVLNAIDAMPKGGVLSIFAELNEESFVIKIQDTGKGISEKDIIRIFEPFFSSKHGGVGLGLTLCYGIIASHGGTIEVESKLRKGTTFSITLPITHTHTEREREKISQVK